MSAAINRVVGLVSMGVGITEQEFRAALTEAWDQGFESGWAAQDPDDYSLNPYRNA